jgi:hypothetical protein
MKHQKYRADPSYLALMYGLRESPIVQRNAHSKTKGQTDHKSDRLPVKKLFTSLKRRMHSKRGFKWISQLD